ncbi:hypothetical protein [Gemmiger sp. An50]|uniref:hypothetical protein n=1 Tax=Gemmiger sp. An50 TaxID=1965639 RepID=UPI000B387C0C|nr:hypothetical protein [Gemmiger sp. An50]OUN86646.1 hypothetical protein B5G03_07210 [Gemmiger sp. An50]
MKKTPASVISVLLCASLVACGTPAPASSTPSSSSVAASAASASSAASDSDSALSDLDSLGDIEVDKNLFDVEITVPADFVGETTQEELDAKAKESDIHSITLNEDGSATYVMSKAQHKKVLEELSASINETLAEMSTSGDFPTITNVSANDDFTNFTVTVSADELGLAESMSVIGLYMYGGLYGIFSGQTPDNIHVDFVNADSGEVISSADSSEAGK